MAEVRAQNDDYQQALMSCLRNAGLNAVLTQGGVVVYTPPGAEGPGGPEAQAAAASETGCYDRIPEPKYYANDLATEYARMLDIQACLEDQGYPLPEPPSREAWVESQGEAHEPYDALIAEMDAGRIPEDIDAVNELQMVCTPSVRGKIYAYDPGR